MKQKITIKNDEKIIYQGRISDIPIKQQAIINKSIELFDDDDPCVIHQSYVIKEYVDELLTLFKNQNTTSISIEQYKESLQFLDLDDIRNTTLTLEG